MIMKLKITTGSGQRKAKLDAIKKLYANPDDDHNPDSDSEPTEIHDEDCLAK